jgi:hypothetical protein
LEASKVPEPFSIHNSNNEASSKTGNPPHVPIAIPRSAIANVIQTRTSRPKACADGKPFGFTTPIINSMEQKRQEREELPLSKAAQYLLEECRMVLPGIQALFGFQLIAVFSNTFSQTLSLTEQRMHLAALGLVAIAAALVMTPASIHRHIGAREVTDRFISISTRLLVIAMYPLAVGISTDFYLIARIILQSTEIALILSLLLLAICSFFWFILPRKIAKKEKST